MLHKYHMIIIIITYLKTRNVRKVVCEFVRLIQDHSDTSATPSFNSPKG